MNKLPDTSHAAKAAFTDPMKQRHYDKIVAALQVLGRANYETIANFLGMKNINQVGRRLKELMPPTEDNPKGLNKIFKPGTTSKTSSGREAYDYCLTNNHPVTDEQLAEIRKLPIKPKISIPSLKETTDYLQIKLFAE